MPTQQADDQIGQWSIAFEMGVLAGAVLTATSANAAMLTWLEWVGTPTTPGIPLIEGDKKVTYVSGSIGAEAVDDVALIKMGDDYYFVYDAMNGPAMANANSGSFTYTIEVTTPDWYIVGVDLDSNVSSNYGTVTETFGEIPGLMLMSTNGLPVPATGFIGISPPLHTLLTITNTLAANTGEGLFDFQNSFHQRYIPNVPEPGTILGLLAVGGLGLVSRFKKQK